MEQVLAAPITQPPETPEKLKKKFCFATIPLIMIALLSLAECIISVLNMLFNMSSVIEDIDEFIYALFTPGYYLHSNFFMFLAFLCIFIGAVLLTVLLFVKVSNAWLGAPLILFAAGYSVLLSLYCPRDMFTVILDGYISDFEDFIDWFIYCVPSVLALLLVVAAFLAVIIYTFIVTSRKKPAPKVLWIIPAVIFSLLFTCSQIVLVFPLRYFDLSIIPILLLILPFIVAITLFLAWRSFLYKKEKSKNEEEIQLESTVESEEKSAVEPAEKSEPKPAVQPPVRPMVRPVYQPPANKSASNPYIEQQESVMKLLKDYKTLLDDGVITKEEFEKKKNELLGI